MYVEIPKGPGEIKFFAFPSNGTVRFEYKLGTGDGAICFTKDITASEALEMAETLELVAGVVLEYQEGLV